MNSSVSVCHFWGLPKKLYKKLSKSCTTSALLFPLKRIFLNQGLWFFFINRLLSFFCLLLRFYFLHLHLAPMKTAAAVQDRWFWTFPNVAKSGDVLFVQHVVQSCMKQFSRMVNSLSTRFLKGFTIFWLAFLWAVLKRCSTSHTRQWPFLQLDSRC